MPHINQSWREQRKAVICTDVKTGVEMEFISVWAASHIIALESGCTPGTAKKEIKKAIATGVTRYGCKWQWKETSIVL